MGEEKKRRKVEKEMVGVGRVEYCSSLRIVLRKKIGVKSKEWKRLEGCWDELMEYLNDTETQGQHDKVRS